MKKLLLVTLGTLFIAGIHAQSTNYVVNGENKKVEIVGNEGITLFYPDAENYNNSGVFIKPNGINIFTGENIKIESIDNNILLKSGPGYIDILAGETLTLSGPHGATLESGNLLLGIRNHCNIKVNSDEYKLDITSDGEMGISVKNDLTINSNSININTGKTYYSGKVGIGTNNPQNALDVLGTIRATEVKIEAKWADFVFADDYILPSLDEVKAHIDEHKHLPGIPSEAEVQQNGIGVSEITSKMMQKIEELTLYIIKQQEEIELLKNKIKD